MISRIVVIVGFMVLLVISTSCSTYRPNYSGRTSNDVYREYKQRNRHYINKMNYGSEKFKRVHVRGARCVGY